MKPVLISNTTMEEFSLPRLRIPMDDGRLMVKIRGARLRYGGEQIVLSGLNLTVAQQEIYGLLGPSGCGKTTILSCIVGRTRLDSGTIEVGVSKRSDLGYMPQDTALFPEFTVKEIFMYYGRIFGMSPMQITKRSSELRVLLQLPQWTTRIETLSGGQQRRTSFAIAVLHDPKLLILDEPTVGVDSLLAHSIWEYLRNLTAKEGKTIIITTHYIDEAKHCNTVALMRGGILLSEGSPSQLLISQNTTNLEDAFLELSKKQEEMMSEIGNNKILQEIQSTCVDEANSTPPFYSKEMFNTNRFIAQSIKNMYWMKRNVFIMFFLLVLPALQSFLFCASFGQDPRDLSVGLVSDELLLNSYYVSCDNASFLAPNFTDTSDCHFPFPFSCEYIKELKSKMNVILYNTVETAEKEGEKNVVWGVIYLSSNFTLSIAERVRHDNFHTSDENLEYGTVKVKMDMSNYIIAQMLRRDITESLMSALTKFFIRCNYQIRDIPIRFNDAIYGSNHPVFAHSGLPGFICSFCFYFTMMFTSGAVMMEKIIGLLERIMISGLTHVEMVGAHLVVQFLLMAAQTAIMLIVFYVFYTNPFVGNIFLLLTLLFAIELVGISYGFLLTEIFSTDRLVSYAGIGTTLAVFSLGGIIWPIQGAHSVIRALIWVFPVAPAVLSYTNITLKGYSLSHPTVYAGFASCIAWIVVFSLGSFLINLYKKRRRILLYNKY